MPDIEEFKAMPPEKQRVVGGTYNMKVDDFNDLKDRKCLMTNLVKWAEVPHEFFEQWVFKILL